MDNHKLTSISAPDNDPQHSMIMSGTDPTVDATAAHNAFLESLHGLGMENLNDLHLNQLNNQLRYELRNLNREVGVNLSDTDDETEGETTQEQGHDQDHDHDHDHSAVDEDELSVLEQSLINAFNESESEPFKNYIKSIVERGYLQTDAMLDLDEKDKDKMTDKDKKLMKMKMKDVEDSLIEDTDKDPLLDLSILGLDTQRRKRKAKDDGMGLDIGIEMNNYNGVPMSIMNRPIDNKSFNEENDHKRRRSRPGTSDEHYGQDTHQQQLQPQSKHANDHHSHHLLEYNLANELRSSHDDHHELSNYVNVGHDVGVDIDLSSLTNMNMETASSTGGVISSAVNSNVVQMNGHQVNLMQPPQSKIKQPVIVEENIKKCSRCRMKRIRESEKELSKYQTCQQCRERRKVKEKKPRVVVKLPNLSDDWDTFLKKVALNTVMDLSQHNYGAYTDKNEFPRYAPEELTVELMNDIGAKVVQKYIQPLQKLTGFRFAVRDHHNPSLYDPNRSKKMTWMFICSQDKLRKRKSRSENKRHVSNKLKTEECCSRITLSYDIVYGILQMSYNHKHHKPLSTNSSSNSDNDDDETKKCIAEGRKNGHTSSVVKKETTASHRSGYVKMINEHNTSAPVVNLDSRDEQQEDADREVMEAAAAAVAAVAAAREDKDKVNEDGGYVGGGYEGVDMDVSLGVDGEQPDHMNVHEQFERIEDIIGAVADADDDDDDEDDDDDDDDREGHGEGEGDGVDAAEIARLLRQVQAVHTVHTVQQTVQQTVAAASEDGKTA